MNFEPIRVAYTVEPGELVKDWMRSRLTVIWPLLPVLLGAMIYLWLLSRSSPEGLILFTGLLAFLAVFLLFRWVQWRMVIKDPGNRRAWEARDVLIDRDALDVRFQDGSSTRIVHTSLVGWDETQRFLHLFIATDRPYPLPKAVLSQDELDRLRVLLQTTLALKRRRYGKL